MASTQPAPRASRAWIWWLTGGCAVALVLAVAAAVFGTMVVFNHLRTSGVSCLPSNFPIYPGAAYAGENYSLNAPTPGNACQMVYRSSDSAITVLDYYSSRLKSGEWQVDSTNSELGQITFRSTKKARTNGYVHVAAKDGYTEITIQFYSP